jgi:hypothetical protein
VDVLAVFKYGIFAVNQKYIVVIPHLGILYNCPANLDATLDEVTVVSRR